MFERTILIQMSSNVFIKVKHPTYGIGEVREYFEFYNEEGDDYD